MGHPRALALVPPSRECTVGCNGRQQGIAHGGLESSGGAVLPCMPLMLDVVCQWWPPIGLVFSLIGTFAGMLVGLLLWASNYVLRQPGVYEAGSLYAEVR